MSDDVLKQFFPEEEEFIPDTPLVPANLEVENDDDGRIAGQGGTVRDPIGAISDTLVDVVDNLFQGDQRSREDITTQRKEATAAKREENRTRDKNVGDLIMEPARIVGGATTGFAEGVLETAEIVGDVGNTIVGKVFPSLYNERNDPFSSKYDWVKWDLGKDDVGAHTAVGRVAQGFGEFGLTLYATGGFKSVAGLGLKLKSLNQGRKGLQLIKGLSLNVPNKAQWGAILKAGTQEGLYGIAADMVSASSGEGNLTNLIKDNFPELLPEWATALAIDEDDNPFEAAIKTAFEGFGLGSSIGAIGAYLSGARAIRKALKANPKLSSIDQQAIGLEAAAKKLSEEDEFIPSNGWKSSLIDVGDELSTTNPAKYKLFEKVVDNLSKDIPVYWDDVADAYPEYFTSGTREVQPAFTSELNRLIKEQSPGFTIDPWTGQPATKGFSVAIDGESIEKIDAESIAAFISKNKDVLSRDDVYLGGWFDPDLGKPVIELSRIVSDLGEATRLGRVFDQKAIIELKPVGEIPIEKVTFGADQLKKTKGRHLSQSFNIPSEAKTTTVNKAYQQIRQTEATNLGGGSQRTLTNAQIHLLSDGDPVLKQILDEQVDLYKMEESALARVAQLSEDQLRQEASDIVGSALGIDGQIDWKKLPRTSDDLLDPVGVVAMRGIIKELAQNLANLGSAVSKNADNGIDYTAQFDLLGANLKAAARIHKKSANLWSAGLRAHGVKLQKNIDGLDFKPPKIEDVEAEKLLNQNTLAKEIKELDKAIDEITTGLKSGDQVARKKALRAAVALELSGGDITKALNAWKLVRELATDQWLKGLYNSMLSSPATHLVNTLSNATNTVYRPMTLYFGGGPKEKAQALKGFYNFQDTLRASWEVAWTTLKDNKPVNAGQKGYKQIADSDRKLAELVEIADRSDDKALQRGVGFLQTQKDLVDFPLFNWPAKFLSTSDEFFKVMVARMEFNQQIMGRAIKDAELSGKPVEELFNSLYKSEFSRNFTPKNAILNPDLLEAGKQVTFQTELEGAAKTFGEFVDSVPVMKIFFPFIKTGHNIMVYTATHVPLLNRTLVQEYKDVMFSSTPDLYAQAMMRGREAVGKWVIGTAGFAAATGLITGNGPSDPNERKTWLLSNRPRSIRLPGGQWLDYSRIEPFGMILSATADLVDYAKKYPLQEKKWEYLVGQLTYILAANVTNKTFLQGLTPLGKLLSPGWQGASSLAKVAPEAINASLPLSAARRALSNAINPYMQEYDSNLLRLLEQATFGISQLGAADDIDWLTGEKLESTSGGLDAFSPLKLTRRGDSPVKDALEDIGFDSSVITKDISGVDLNVKQQARMKELMGRSGLNAELEKLVTSKGWKKAKNDFYWNNLLRGKSKKNTWFYDQVKNIITKYRDRAKEVVIQENEQLQRDILQRSIDRQLPQRNNPTELIDFSRI